MISLRERDKGFAAMMARAKEAKAARIKVGALSSEQEPGGDLTVGEIAAIQELGTEDGRIPARPFIRPTFERERGRLAEMGKELLAEVVEGKIKVNPALGVMGAYLATAIKNTITAGVAPPNAMSTLIAKARKSRSFKPVARTVGQAIGNAGILSAAKPLIDTGRLLNSITWAIVTGEE